MSIKLRLKYRYRSVRQLIESVRLPAWVWSKWIKGIVGILVVVMGVGYMFQINAVATSGYVLHTLEKQIAVVNDETNKLDSEVASTQSLSNIKERLKAVDSDMVAASQIQYVSSLEKTAFAR